FLAIEKFRKRLSVSVDHKSGLTTVTLSGRHPGMLAAAVNELVAELQRQSLELRVDVARDNERFLGQQEAAAHDSLTRAEAELAGAVAMFLAAFGLFREPKGREVAEPEAGRLRAVPEAPSRLGRIS